MVKSKEVEDGRGTVLDVLPVNLLHHIHPTSKFSTSLNSPRPFASLSTGIP